jgi:Asp-tRNA(Asn)/Glu-tRNA(Gln) amidotransferase A subunit family amidase
MDAMSSEIWRMTAVEAVGRLKKKEISPLDLVEASARRIAEVEPAVNAMPTLCLDRARDHAKRVMAGGEACAASRSAASRRWRRSARAAGLLRGDISTSSAMALRCQGSYGGHMGSIFSPCGAGHR